MEKTFNCGKAPVVWCRPLKVISKSPARTPKKFKENIWVGSVDFSPQIWKKVKDQTIKGANFKVEPIHIPPEVYDNYYNGFSNSTLWPLFHYFPFLAEYDKDFFEDYVQVNFLFADKILSFAKKDDVIWVHDYQLMLLPQILRKKRPDLTIYYLQ